MKTTKSNMSAVKTILIACAILFFGACSSGDGSTGRADGEGGGAPTIKTIGDLPAATGPVAEATAAASMSASGVTKAATTGLNLRSTDSSAFSAISSMGACQVFNYVRKLIDAAAHADTVLCYVNYIDGTNVLADAGTDVYDGSWHIYNLNVADSENAPDKVKMRIVKNSAGSITSFEMFLCRADTQYEHMLQLIDGDDFAMEATGNHADSSGAGWYDIDVTGSLNESGTFVSKNIVARHSGIWSGNSHWEEATLSQSPGIFEFTGYEAGEYADGSSSGTFQNAGYAKGEFLDTNTLVDLSAYDLGLLAIGDGAVKYLIAGSVDGTPYGPTAGIDAWYGDTGLPVEIPTDDTPFFTAAVAGTPPDASTTAPSIDFAADETWDCSDDVAASVNLPTIDGSAMDAACQRLIIDSGWINCWDIIGE